jgi:GTP-binding protein EngB required for normal cell division
MHIQLIGKHMENFLKLISASDIPTKAKTNPKDRKIIEDFWDFDYSSNKEVKEQIDEYFNFLYENKNKQNRDELKECLIVRVKNSSDENINIIFEKMNGLRKHYLMPIVLFLTDEKCKQINPDIKYKYLNRNLIISKLYSEEKAHYQEDGIIKKLLLRFCSFFNELGDSFSLGEGNNVMTYDLNKNYFPFNVNLLCIGRFGQGKSTGVNEILGEFKAKESSKLVAQTKYITLYQQSNFPIRILDIPGFDSPENVQLSIDKIKLCNQEINKVRDKIHCYLYFLQYTERGFTGLETPVIAEIIKNKEARILYVITHSPSNLDEEDQEEYIINLNESIDKLTNSEVLKNNKNLAQKILKATNENIVFVNFRKDVKTNSEVFGKEILFQKIRNIFHQTEDYKKSLEKLSPERIKELAEKLKEQAKRVVLFNKIGGGIVGIIPGLDWILQRFVIKENAAKKIGMVYGIDVNYFKGEEKKIIKKKEEEKNKEQKEEKNKELPGIEKDIYYDENALDLEIDANELVNDSTSYKIGNSFKVGTDVGSIVSGAISLGVGFSRVATTVGEAAAGGVEIAAEAAVAGGSIAARAAGFILLGVGVVLGVASGAYFTTKHCNELIEKCHNYYLNNAEKISNSYIEADKYLEIRSKLESNQHH